MPRLSGTARSGSADGSDRSGRREPVVVRRRRRGPRRAALLSAATAMCLAPVVGLLWWASAPGVRRQEPARYVDAVQVAGEQDALFALLCALAGAATGIWWVLARGPELDARAPGRLVGLLVGGVLAGALAWTIGWGLDVLLGGTAPVVPPAEPVPDAVPAAGVATVAGVLLWPLVTAALVFVDTLRDVVARMVADPDRQRGALS